MKQPKINPIDAALQAIGRTQSKLARKIGVTPAVVTAHILNPYIPAPFEVQAAPKADV